MELIIRFFEMSDCQKYNIWASGLCLHSPFAFLLLNFGPLSCDGRGVHYAFIHLWDMTGCQLEEMWGGWSLLHSNGQSGLLHFLSPRSIVSQSVQGSASLSNILQLGQIVGGILFQHCLEWRTWFCIIVKQGLKQLYYGCLIRILNSLTISFRILMTDLEKWDWKCTFDNEYEMNVSQKQCCEYEWIWWKYICL